MSLEFQNAEMEAATTLLSLRLEPGRPTPLRRCNALSASGSASDSAGGSTETGANACEGGAARPETPVYTPEDSPSPDGDPCLCSENRGIDCDCWEKRFCEGDDWTINPCLCGDNRGADCDCWEHWFREPEDGDQTEGGDVSAPSAERS